MRLSASSNAGHGSAGRAICRPPVTRFMWPYPSSKPPSEYARPGQAGGLQDMATPIREPFLAYVLVHAHMLRRQRVTAPAVAERLEAPPQAPGLPAGLGPALPPRHQRALAPRTLAARGGPLAPG